MENQEILETITRVATRLAPKYVFGHYDREDIEQEAILMGFDALKRYDGIRPLENFIYTHISNRLKTFKRDKYFRLNSGTAEAIQQSKKNIIDAISIDSISPVREEKGNYYDDVKTCIEEHLPMRLKKDYMRMCAGVKVSKKIKTEITAEIRGIMEKYDENW